MSHDCRFATYNPIISFIYYIGAIALTMFLNHPAYLICSLVFSFTLFCTVKGSGAFKLLIGLFPVFIIVSLINPLLNTMGKTILFTYFGRPFTLEALLYGFVAAAIFVSVITWFASYNEIMTGDKFLYVFGRFAPAVSMIVTMVLRFVPNYTRQALKISDARKCVGMGVSGSELKAKSKEGATIISVLTSWAFEGGIVTADSMKSRGYGTGKRTSFSLYRFSANDVFLSAVLITLFGIVVFCGVNGAVDVSFIPDIVIPALNNTYTAMGIVAYALFLVTPTAINLLEEVTWLITKSKI